MRDYFFKKGKEWLFQSQSFWRDSYHKSYLKISGLKFQTFQSIKVNRKLAYTIFIYLV